MMKKISLIHFNHKKYISRSLQFGGIMCFIGYGYYPRMLYLLYLGIILVCVNIIMATYYFWKKTKGLEIKRELARKLDLEYQVIRSGEERNIIGCEIVPGDLVRITTNAIFPADIRVVESEGLNVSHRYLSHAPQNSAVGVDPEVGLKKLIESRNVCLFGGEAKSGEGRGIVFATGNKTVLISQIEAKTLWDPF